MDPGQDMDSVSGLGTGLVLESDTVLTPVLGMVRVLESDTVLTPAPGTVRVLELDRARGQVLDTGL